MPKQLHDAASMIGPAVHAALAESIENNLRNKGSGYMVANCVIALQVVDGDGDPCTYTYYDDDASVPMLLGLSEIIFKGVRDDLRQTTAGDDDAS